MGSAETPYLLAGVVAIGTGVARTKGWPEEAPKAMLSTMVLVILASLSADTPAEPLVRALGLLLLLSVAVMAARGQFTTQNL